MAVDSKIKIFHCFVFNVLMFRITVREEKETDLAGRSEEKETTRC
jgi:hypothetical protein